MTEAQELTVRNMIVEGRVVDDIANMAGVHSYEIVAYQRANGLPPIVESTARDRCRDSARAESMYRERLAGKTKQYLARKYRMSEAEVTLYVMWAGRRLRRAEEW